MIMTRNSMNISTRVALHDGWEIPVLGLGTYLIGDGMETQKAVMNALEAGYRHIDTAMFYGNERGIGEAIRRSGVPRDELFITTKLWNSDHGYHNTIAAFNESLERLGLDYIDLYLIHWPVEELRNESWRALVHILEGDGGEGKGKCRSIGVSNYMIWHLEELMENSSYKPVVNQIEFSPFLYQKDLLDFCRSHSIQVEAYSPLTKGKKLGDPTLAEIASHYSKSPAQILIRWGLQKDVIVIPKSSEKKRIQENADVFDFVISEEDMDRLDSLNRDLRTSWDPSTVP